MMISKKRDSHFRLWLLSWFLILLLLLLLHCSGFCFFLYVSIMQVESRERHVKLCQPKPTLPASEAVFFFFLYNNTCWLANCIMQRDTRAVVLSTLFALNMLGTAWQIGQILIGFQFIYWLEDFYYIIIVINQMTNNHIIIKIHEKYERREKGENMNN